MALKEKTKTGLELVPLRLESLMSGVYQVFNSGSGWTNYRDVETTDVNLPQNDIILERSPRNTSVDKYVKLYRKGVMVQTSEAEVDLYQVTRVRDAAGQFYEGKELEEMLTGLKSEAELVSWLTHRDRWKGVNYKLRNVLFEIARNGVGEVKVTNLLLEKAYKMIHESKHTEQITDNLEIELDGAATANTIGDN